MNSMLMPSENDFVRMRTSPYTAFAPFSEFFPIMIFCVKHFFMTPFAQSLYIFRGVKFADFYILPNTTGDIKIIF